MPNWWNFPHKHFPWNCICLSHLRYRINNRANMLSQYYSFGHEHRGPPICALQSRRIDTSILARDVSLYPSCIIFINFCKLHSAFHNETSQILYDTIIQTSKSFASRITDLWILADACLTDYFKKDIFKVCGEAHAFFVLHNEVI